MVDVKKNKTEEKADLKKYADIKWFQEKDSLTKEAIKFTEELGEELVDKPNYKRNAMSTSQLRNFFGEVRRIQSNLKENKPAFYMLRPKLAYAVARARGKENKIYRFKEVVDNILLNINPEPTEFNNFVNFLEAIVAYHKVNGGE